MGKIVVSSGKRKVFSPDVRNLETSIFLGERGQWNVLSRMKYG